MISQGKHKARVNLEIAESSTPKDSAVLRPSKDGGQHISVEFYDKVGGTAAQQVIELKEQYGVTDLKLRSLETVEDSSLRGPAKFLEKAATQVASSLFGGAAGALVGVSVADVFSTAVGNGCSESVQQRALTNGGKLVMAESFVESGSLESAIEARDKWVKTLEEKNGPLTPSQQAAIQNIVVGNSNNGTLTIL